MRGIASSLCACNSIGRKTRRLSEAKAVGAAGEAKASTQNQDAEAGAG